MAKEATERKSTAKKKSGGKNSHTLRSVVAGAASTDAIMELIEKLGVVDLVVDRIKGRIEETDVDELFDEVTDYLRRNPEVLVVSLGAVTVATALVVWLNSRREWNGTERRRAGMSDDAPSQQRSRKAS